MKPIKAYATYQEALDAERDREKQWRQTRQGAFESSFVSFEETKEAFYPLGAVVGRKTRLDPKKAHEAYSKAYKRVLRQAPECIEVFKLILKNGKERQKSIWEMVDKIKKQSGVLKKTHSMKPQKDCMNDTVSRSCNSSASKSKMMEKQAKKRRCEMSQKFRGEKS